MSAANSTATMAPPTIRYSRLSLASAYRSPDASCENLARIHDSGGVERVLDRTHHVERRPVLPRQVLDLALADAVLAGAGAFHGDGAHVQPADERIDALDLG